MIYKIIYIILMASIFLGCSPKKLFPTDNKEYDNPKNYDYKYSEHKFNSKDGTPLYGIYIQTKKKSKGLIVVSNGIYQNMSYRFTQWLWVVDAGYDFFIFDYRGYGNSNAEADLYGFVDDVNAAVEYAHTLDIDKKIILVGQSMGGTFVIDALRVKEYDYISLAVIDSTFTGFATAISSFMMRSIILLPMSWLPYAFSPSELNSIKNIEYLKVPILFISGDDDFIVNYENSKEIYKKANTKKAIWIVEDAGHVQSFNNQVVREAFLKFLMKEELLSENQERYFDKRI